MGSLVLIVGLAALAYGVVQHFKGKRILSAPFRKTGELARNPHSPDPKGAISTEGTVKTPAQPLLSPCSKTPCLYYEVKIERLFEKEEETDEEVKTVSGSNTLDTLKGGATVGLDDGSGTVRVDFSKGADFDNFKGGFHQKLDSGDRKRLQLGKLEYPVPALSSLEGETVGYEVTERFVPVAGTLFVLGKLEGSKIVKPNWRSMMASSKGREGLLASTATKKKVSWAVGGVAMVASAVLVALEPNYVEADDSPEAMQTAAAVDLRGDMPSAQPAQVEPVLPSAEPAVAGPRQFEVAQLAVALASGSSTFEGEMLEVRGVVADVERDRTDTLVAFVAPSGPDGDPVGVVAMLGPKVKVRKGQTITVRGTAAEGDTSGVVLAEAELISTAKAAKAPTKPSRSKKTRAGRAKTHG